jgi:2-polyprenyl-3-methyl-5-hydroxy-6-metoxy-1,4-benzoquinol methylase
MPKFCLADDESVDSVIAWFSQFGCTDSNYLRAHFSRYVYTRDFSLFGVPAGIQLTVLDIGAHWLHNAFFYANRGHHLICMDAPDVLGMPSVMSAAEAMSAEIRPNKRMEKADGFVGITDNSVDLVLFCEIIEHLAFNPIPFWRQVYRVLKPLGHIIVTTPNAFYYRSLAERIRRIFRGECYGLSVYEILSNGTYGHHWKEFSLPELQEYFSYLSPDFDTSRFEMAYLPGDKSVHIEGQFENMISKNVNVRAREIYLDVKLNSKVHGITMNPPWDVT